MAQDNLSNTPAFTFIPDDLSESSDDSSGSLMNGALLKDDAFATDGQSDEDQSVTTGRVSFPSRQYGSPIYEEPSDGPVVQTNNGAERTDLARKDQGPGEMSPAGARANVTFVVWHSSTESVRSQRKSPDQYEPSDVPKGKGEAAISYQDSEPTPERSISRISSIYGDSRVSHNDTSLDYNEKRRRSSPQRTKHWIETQTDIMSSRKPPRRGLSAYVEDADDEEPAERKPQRDPNPQPEHFTYDSNDHHDAPMQHISQRTHPQMLQDDKANADRRFTWNVKETSQPVLTRGLATSHSSSSRNFYDDDDDDFSSSQSQSRSRSSSPVVRIPISSNRRKPRTRKARRQHNLPRQNSPYRLRPQLSPNAPVYQNPFTANPDQNARAFAPYTPASASSYEHPRYGYGRQQLDPYGSVYTNNYPYTNAGYGPYQQNYPYANAGYGPYQQNYPYYPSTNPYYFQPPPPPPHPYGVSAAPYVGQQTRGPAAEQDHHAGDEPTQARPTAKPSTSTVPVNNLTGLYKPATSFDTSANEISFQVLLKSRLDTGEQDPATSGVRLETSYAALDPTLRRVWLERHYNLPRDGTSELSTALAIEHYGDGVGQDKITIINPSSNALLSAEDETKKLRWLHLEQSTHCLRDLVDLVSECRFLDEDYIALALELLQVECPKFEKKFSNGQHGGYYIEPGTVLRYDGRYENDIRRGHKSVLFCSAPYLHLAKHRAAGEGLEPDGTRIHRSRTLLESLYDYDLMDERDSAQAVRKHSGMTQEAIICVPQVWYLLCGSNVLISCSQASMADIRGESIHEKAQSEKNLIAMVTDLDNHRFPVALKATDSYFAAVRMIESSRSNVGCNLINDYDIKLETGETLTPKKWLDIVSLGTLPLLKLTLQRREQLSDNSLALIVRPRPAAPGDGDASSARKMEEPGVNIDAAQDSNLESSEPESDISGHGPYDRSLVVHTSQITRHTNGHHLSSPQTDAGYPHNRQLQLFNEHQIGTPGMSTYPLDSYTGALAKTSGSSKTLTGGRLEYYDDHSESTLVDSMISRQQNNDRRVSALNARGIVVNDMTSVSAEPEVFKFEPPKAGAGLESAGGQHVNVWDFYIPGDGDKTSLVDDYPVDEACTHHEDTDPMRAETYQARDKGKGPERLVRLQSHVPDGSTAAVDRSHGWQAPDTNRPIFDDSMLPLPFLQWRYGASLGGTVDSDDIVRRVLDQVHERLGHNPEYFKHYRKSHASTLPDLSDLNSHLNEVLPSPRADSSQFYAETSESGAKAAVRSNAADRILEHRKKSVSKIKQEFRRCSLQLIGTFIPVNFEHDATSKFWGGMAAIFQAMDNVFGSRKQTQSPVYHVQDYSKDADLLHAMVMHPPEVPFDGCPECTGVFHSLESGVAHLRDVHFKSTCVRPSLQIEDTLRLYLRTPEQIRTEARINNIILLAEESIGSLATLGDQAAGLRMGATKLETSSEEKGYPVMEKLVDRLMRTENIRHSQRTMAKPLRSLRHIRSQTQKHLENAKIDIILASKTDSRTGGVTLSSIGPEFMVALISNGLFLRKLEDTSGQSLDPCELYKQYTTSLQFQVNQKPQKRLFADMYALEEELDILRRVIHWQHKFCNNLLRVLDPASYKVTTKGRISHFHLESQYIFKTLTRLDARDFEFDNLQKRTRNLREQLKQSIEVREESHGKAIRVFTFVTVFFLPLSFVTSFMGMNTADIRDIDQNQTFFWIIALPVTAVVIGIAFIYGYKWDAWKEVVAGRYRLKPQDAAQWDVSSVLPGLRRRKSRLEDPEEGGVKRSETDRSMASNLSAKKRVRFKLWPANDSV